MAQPSSASSALRIAGYTVAAAATGVLAYAVYFDYRRRNDTEFRRRLRKDAKRTSKQAKKAGAEAEKDRANQIAQIVQEVQGESVPASATEKEQIFLQQVTKGETTFPKGPEFYVEAAAAFFRALKVYPQPVELIMIYQKAVPAEVFNIIMELVAKDVSTGQSDSSLSGMPGMGGPSASLNDVDEEEPAKAASGATTDAAPGFGTASGPSTAPSSGTGSGNEAETQNAGVSSTPSLQEWETLSATSVGPTGAPTSAPPAESLAEIAKDAPLAANSSSQATPPVASPTFGFGSAPGARKQPDATDDVHFHIGGSPPPTSAPQQGDKGEES